MTRPLYERVAAHDKEGLRELVGIVKRIARAVTRTTHGQHLANVTGNVYLTAINKTGTHYKGTGTYVGWLTAIARNEHKMAIRSEKRRAERESRWNDRHVHATPPPQNPEQIVIDKQQTRMVREGLLSLPDYERYVLTELFYRDARERDIAVTLGVTPEAVSQFKQKGLEGLETYLRDLGMNDYQTRWCR